MKSNFFNIALAVVMASLAFGSPVHADSIYTFDKLNLGNLAGQDGWTNGGGVATVTSSTVSGGGNCAYASGGATVRRLNDSNWSFTNTAASGSIIMLMDVLGNNANPSFGLEYNSADDGPSFGISTGKLRIRSGMFSGTNYMIAISSVLTDYAAGDWLQLKCVLNVANDNAVTATLYARDLTKGDTAWTTNAAISGISLGTYTDVSKWNQLVLRLDSGGTVDNLTIASVPEPSVMMLLGTGVLGLLAYAWRKRRG